MTNKEFIEAIAPSFQKWGRQFGYKLISPAIAQACLESGYGTSFKATFGHNILGLKYRPNRVTCNDGFFLNGGSEQNPDGSYTLLPSNTAWYNFKDWDTCIHGYYEFISISSYDAVRAAKTPLEYLQKIKAANYATSLNYVNNVMAVVNKWNLTQYDNAGSQVSQQPTQASAINIIQKTSTHNTTPTNRKPEWIVLHYTAGTSSAQGAAKNVAAYFSKSPNQASADFIVDDVDIVQYNPDPTRYYCWSVGGGKYTNKANSLSAKYYGQCTNKNSVSIEMCSRKKNTSTLNASDPDWYITEETVNNAAKLTQYLKNLYNIDNSHIIMHNMVTGKLCPQPWCRNEAALTNWNNFLSKLNIAIPTKPAEAQSSSQQTQAPSYIVKITAAVLNIRSGPSTVYPVVGQIKDMGKYTIVEEKSGWGKLKSGKGWISLKYTKKI